MNPPAPTLGQVIPIAIPGGPCAAKTSAIPKVIEALGLEGYLAVGVPEAASLQINSNVAPWNAGNVSFHRYLAHTQIMMEAHQRFILDDMRRRAYRKIAHRPAVLLCDRGLLDIGAYFTPHYSKRLVRAILARHKLTIRDALLRYRGVIHMVTAAKGAEEFYTVKNNPARKERELEQARVLDDLTIKAWIGHPDHVIVANVDQSGRKIGIEEKVERVIREALRIVRAAEAESVVA